MASKTSTTNRSSNIASVNVKHAEPEPRKKITIKPPSPQMPFLTKEAAEGPLGQLGAVANQLYQEAKLQLEQSGNIRATIKETVIECLSSLYTISLRLSGGTPSSPAVSTVTESNFTKEILEELKEQREMLVVARQDMGTVKEGILKISETIGKSKITGGVSYAAMAATPIVKASSTPQPVHSVVISSVDNQDTSEDVITKIRSGVNATTSGLRVDRLRKAREGKVVLGCHTRDELAKVAERLKAQQPTLLIQETTNKDPLVIIKNVLNINTDEDVLSALKKQNQNILGAISDGDYRASVRFRRKARNPLESHVVLQVSPPVWQSLTSAAKVHVDLQRVTVEDQSPLVTCSRCLGYGHGRKTCQESIDTCNHCAGSHLRSECPAWRAGDRPTCRNCQSSRLDQTDHSSFHESCPIRKKWDALARSKVAYC
ncbi:jg2572 [Pararge aegeria aegeria]|uniref:Jg2572 protein n=1 Tax=Pararge aegeria aegeria TaxID=348720 RepID=A0A8S4R264_9NEOP|nr:jg2572 [Pararge aegeria aegeria]